MDASIRDEKRRLRAEALSRRDALGEEERIESSLRISDLCQDELASDRPSIVSGFLPIRSEVDVRPLMAAFADKGARLCVPAITNGRLVFRELLRGAELVPQGLGTVAPGPEAAVLRPSLMLVPLAAFDRSCRRIGYGKGYYDGAIASLKADGIAPKLVGIGFSVQEVGAVPVEDHDETLAMVVTEKGIVRP